MSGFSDIFGTVMEFVLNDSLDTPDFLIGEACVSSVKSARTEGPATHTLGMLLSLFTD